PKSSAAKALEAKPAKSRKPSVNTASRYELDIDADDSVPAKRSKSAAGKTPSREAKTASKTSKTSKSKR
ncbi:MAG: Ribonuclease, partial [Massilia sp.]|nr:Ribonuclease [Massilia sp.]